VPSLLAVLAVTSLITALYVWRGESSEPTKAAAATSAASRSPRATATATATPTKAAAATKATTSAPVAAPDATTASAAATEADSSAPEEAAPALPVVVLNETTRRGLAATVADRLRGKGWVVAGVGNFRGNVPATTVYYPPGAEAQARAAAASLPTPARIRPRFGNLSTSRLTVVVARNYPG
jgi:hypothetical protein